MLHELTGKDFRVRLRDGSLKSANKELLALVRFNPKSTHPLEACRGRLIDSDDVL
jgi:hypothetical protein